MSALHDRLASLARVAEEATDALDLRDARAELQRLRAPGRVTTAMGLRLAEIHAQKLELRRAARAEHLRSLPTLADAEAHAAANPKDP